MYVYNHEIDIFCLVMGFINNNRNIFLFLSILLFYYNPMSQLSIYTEVYVYVVVDMNLLLHKPAKKLQSEYSIHNMSQ